ncbi:tRNA 2-thiouridine(34) synthase MnmA [Metamycoplasma hyosynoviae]|uniref:tRNA 2-thiouridine(34) synthase MnmA n=1 Tax=Metamycoplasma hyosynoviae TaxID=29559 RepID=UPI002365A0D7|nr:tRNA 2-thiouridine(34) synthase MnmA [Metamycoplasma hyosynoviae]MDD7893371.1 tRNA 2-thiouridine(34) synthase MnmA [Metamycoplasma hyosynoviae]MDD7907402.1 tRNA 2-thiouridine(34) synthase MnmA [Metamycoplasma hyosynoviae]
MKKRVVLGMSGGVDSSVCVHLLLEQGYEVIGLFMRNWDSFTNNDFLGNQHISQDICPQEQDYKDAQAVADQFNIKLYRVDFVKEYWDNVFQYLIDEYTKGRTPNPDIYCNKYIKFHHFANYAFNILKADYIAMGHYAKQENGMLYKAKDLSKDQSYFLAQLSSTQLQKVIFPLSDLTKEEVRNIAKKLKLKTADKKDSTGICFIGERKFTEFLKNYIAAMPGNIIDIATNQIVGTHTGAMYYTIGQRKGLSLGGFEKPYFVVGHNIHKKILYVANDDHPEYLQSNKLIATDVNFLQASYEPQKLTAKFRYRQNDIPITLKTLENNSIFIEYPLTEAVTPGQQVVVYEGDKVVCGGVIDKVYLNSKLKNYL